MAEYFQADVHRFAVGFTVQSYVGLQNQCCNLLGTLDLQFGGSGVRQSESRPTTLEFFYRNDGAAPTTSVSCDKYNSRGHAGPYYTLLCNSALATFFRVFPTMQTGSNQERIPTKFEYFSRRSTFDYCMHCVAKV
jgi:hypothetical protein